MSTQNTASPDRPLTETEKHVRTPDELSEQDFLDLAHSRFKLAEEAEARWRREAHEDFQFFAGDQWPADIKSQRNIDKRPCLTINRIKTSKNIITNEQRQQRPAIQVNPVGNGATVDKAQVVQGMVRHIEVDSEAEIADDITFDNLVIGGMGFYHLRTEYRKGKTFEQDIKIDGIKNSFRCYLDPSYEKPDGSDAKWGFLITDLTVPDFKAAHPKAQAASLDDFSSVGDNAKDWISKDFVRVALYYYIDYEDVTYYQLADGSIVEELPEGVEALKQRTEQIPHVKACTITAVDKLDAKDTVWESVPLIPAIGEDLDINGKRYVAGMVRSAKDPQRSYNFYESGAAEMVTLGPKAPYLMAEGQDKNHEQEWKNANVKNYSRLIYKRYDEAGRDLGQPTRNSIEPPIEAMVQMRQSAAENIQATTGINDANLGQRKADESGRAVLLRQKQGDVSSINFSDNLARAKRRIGRMIVKAMPKVYDTTQVMRIINPDQTVDHAIVHNDDAAGAAELQAKNPQIKNVIDWKVDGDYDVTVSVGPSYQTKRQEAVASIMALIQAAPQVLSVVGDLLVGNMDWNNAKEIAARLKKMLPPQLQDDPNQDPAAAAQQAQGQLAALQQVHQQVVGALQQAQQIIQTKQVEMKGKFDIEQLKTNAEILMAKMKALTPIIVAEINTKAQDSQLRTQIDADVATELHTAAHEVASQTLEHQQTLEQQQQSAAAAAAQAKQAQDAQAAQALQQPEPAATT
jgi:Phage P22-like portal protein